MKSNSRTKQIFSVVLISLPIIAILWRWEYRSFYYPGWDILGSANGLFLLSTESFWPAIKQVFWLSRHFQYWNQTNSVIYSLVPGFLTSLYKWEFWAHVTTFATFFTTLYCIYRITALKAKHISILAGLLCCSPTLLSLSIAGYPYISGLLTHALILAVIFSQRLQTRPIITFILGLLILEVSWHVYQLGKVFFIPLFLAAFLLDNAPKRARITWGLLGLISLYVIIQNSPGEIDGPLGSLLKSENILLAIYETLKITFLQREMDLPILPILGLCCLPLLPNNRRFWTFCLLFQWALIFNLGIFGLHELRPRRFSVLEFYNIIVCLLALRYVFTTSSRSAWLVGARLLLPIAVTVGIAWQFLGLWTFTKVDISQRSLSLPYTQSSADYRISPKHILAARAISELVDHGKKVILLYNYYAYVENTTDPTAVLERIYLKQGHSRFRDNIYVFSSGLSRYSHVPIRHISELDLGIKQIRSSIKENPRLAEDFVVLRYAEIHDNRFRKEADQIFRALSHAFELRLMAEPPHPVFDEALTPLFKIYALKLPTSE